MTISRREGERVLCQSGKHKPILIQEEPFRATLSEGDVVGWDHPIGATNFVGRVVCVHCGIPLLYRVEYWRVGGGITVILRELDS